MRANRHPEPRVHFETRMTWGNIDVALAGHVARLRSEGEVRDAMLCDRIRRAIKAAAAESRAEPLGVIMRPDEAALFCKLFPLNVQDQRAQSPDYRAALARFRKAAR